MSTTALHIVELVKNLPLKEQRLICNILSRQIADRPRLKRPLFLKKPDGSYFNPEGIPNEDPFFKIMQQIEEERHKTPARPAPDFK